MDNFRLGCSCHSVEVETDLDQIEFALDLWKARNTLLVVFAHAAEARKIGRDDWEDLIEVETFVRGKRIGMDLEEFILEHLDCPVYAKGPSGVVTSLSQ